MAVETNFKLVGTNEASETAEEDADEEEEEDEEEEDDDVTFAIVEGMLMSLAVCMSRIMAGSK